MGNLLMMVKIETKIFHIKPMFSRYPRVLHNDFDHFIFVVYFIIKIDGLNDLSNEVSSFKWFLFLKFLY